MAITSGMAKMTIRSTFALDPETVEELARLAERWQVSKSEVVRRIVHTAAVIDETDAAYDALAALKELQESLALTDAGYQVSVICPRGSARDTASHEVIDGVAKGKGDLPTMRPGPVGATRRHRSVGSSRGPGTPSPTT